MWADGYPFADELDVARLYLRIVAETGDPAPFGPYVVRLRETGEAIGGLGFFGPPDAATGVVEFGYGLVADRARRGPRDRGRHRRPASWPPSREPAVARADTTPANVASQRVMEKAGMTEVERSAASVVYEVRF